MTELSRWENFYVIVGSSAGALIGLQFVLITLIASIPVSGGGEQAGNAFATPTVVHFGSVLLLAGIISAPWLDVHPASLLFGLLGISGFIYSAIVTRRMRAQDAYKPEFEDWLFHSLLPIAAYGILALSSLAAHLHLRASLFSVGASSLLLLFIGIHNAWDAATYHVFVVRRRQQESKHD